jgi:hypothetical protein
MQESIKTVIYLFSRFYKKDLFVVTDKIKKTEKQTTDISICILYRCRRVIY